MKTVFYRPLLRIQTLKSVDKRKFYLLLNSLTENGIIEIKDSNYGRIKFLKDQLDKNYYKEIFAGMNLQ